MFQFFINLFYLFEFIYRNDAQNIYRKFAKFPFIEPIK